MTFPTEIRTMVASLVFAAFASFGIRARPTHGRRARRSLLGGRFKMKMLVNVCVAVTVVVLAWSRADAAIDVHDPFGSVGTLAYMFEDSPSTYIAFKNMQTEECRYFLISRSDQIHDNVRIFGDGGDDEIHIGPLFSGQKFCDTDDMLIFGDDASHWVAVFGGDGNDRIFNNHSVAYIWGDAGDDFLSSDSPYAFIAGGEGNDTIIDMPRYVSGNGSAGFYGGNGNDCIYIPMTLWLNVQSCGGGYDQWSGPAPRPADCEVTNYCCGLPCPE